MSKLSLSILALVFVFGANSVFAAKCKDHKEEAACTAVSECHWKVFKSGKGKCMNAPKKQEKKAHEHDTKKDAVAPAPAAPAAAPVPPAVAPAAPAAH